MNVLRNTVRWVKRFYVDRWLTPIHQQRRSARLAQYNVADRAGLPSMTVDCGEHAEARACATCKALIQSYTGFYGRLYRGEGGSGQAAAGQLTMHGIDVQRYGDFATYRRALGKRSSFFLRNAKQAAKAGYRLEFFNAHNFGPDIESIYRSVKVRYFGLMPEAWRVNTKRFGGPPNKYHELEAPACAVHWERLVGVFISKPGYTQGNVVVDQQLVGYARLHRIGNMLAYKDFIGHGQYMGDGVMKLLHIYIMRWVLGANGEPTDPLVKGICHVAHGTLERGNEGLFFWKKKGLFAPYRVNMVEASLPEGFSPEAYVALNPDLVSSKLSPALHYRLYGRHENRAYQHR